MDNYCRVCGARLKTSTNFCPNCGTEVQSSGGAHPSDKPTKRVEPPDSTRATEASAPVAAKGSSCRLVVFGALLTCAIVCVATFAAYVLRDDFWPSDYEDLPATAPAETGYPLATGSDSSLGPEPAVVDSWTEVIGVEGGLIEAGAWEIEAPAGAVAAETTVSVRQLDARGYLEPGRGGILLDITAPVSEFAEAIELRAALPSWYTPEDTWAAMALLLDPETGFWQYESATVEVIDGRPMLVLETDHLSWRLFEWLDEMFEYKFPPEQAEPLELPYYSQGITPNCLAAVLQMAAQSAKYRPEGEVHGFMGALGPAYFGEGQGNPRLRWSHATGAYLTQQTDKAAKRIYWMALQQQIQVEYIQRQLAFERRPVLLSSYTAGHALLLVGYPDRKSFYVHNPQQTTGTNSNMYRRMTLEQLGLDETGNLTIVVPTAPAADRPLVSVNLLDECVDFAVPTGDYYSYRWDVSDARGYVIRANRPVPKGRLVEVIPSDVAEVVAQRASYSGIEVANAHMAGDSKSVLLRIEVVGHGPGQTHYEQSQTIELPPRTTRRVGFSTFAVDEFRDPAPQNVRYTFRAAVTVDGKVTDEASFEFVLEPLLPPSPVPTRQATGNECICPDGEPLPLDYSLGCSTLLVPPMDPDWEACYRGCVEACGCDPKDLDLTCACDCLGLSY